MDRYDLACRIYTFFYESCPAYKDIQPYETAEIVLDYFTRLNSNKAILELSAEIIHTIYSQKNLDQTTIDNGH